MSAAELANRDPGDQSELQEAYRRSMDLYASELTPSTPGEPSTPVREPNSPIPVIEHYNESGRLQPAVHDSESQITRLPHSSSSYDLRSHALTPGKPADNPRLGLSRIPHSTVMHAVALQPISPNSPANRSVSSPTPDSDGTYRLLGPYSPASPGRRSGGSAASTKVIDVLQSELQHYRTQVEKVRQDLRSSQRVVESLTRQNEDLKETRERLRSECDQLNHVIARKERLLQETAEKKRTAETELKEQKSTRQALEKSTKKSLHTMQSQVNDAHLAQHRAESECNSLRDTLRSLRDVWAREVKGLKEEWKNSLEKERTEREQVKLKHTALAKLVQAQSEDRQRVQLLSEDVIKQSGKASAAYEEELAEMRAQVEKNTQETQEAKDTAQHLATELQHLRRLMRATTVDNHDK